MNEKGALIRGSLAGSTCSTATSQSWAASMERQRSSAAGLGKSYLSPPKAGSNRGSCGGDLESASEHGSSRRGSACSWSSPEARKLVEEMEAEDAALEQALAAQRAAWEEQEQLKISPHAIQAFQKHSVVAMGLGQRLRQPASFLSDEPLFDEDMDQQGSPPRRATVGAPSDVMEAEVIGRQRRRSPSRSPSVENRLSTETMSAWSRKFSAMGVSPALYKQSPALMAARPPSEALSSSVSPSSGSKGRPRSRDRAPPAEETASKAKDKAAVARAGSDRQSLQVPRGAQQRTSSASASSRKSKAVSSTSSREARDRGSQKASPAASQELGSPDGERRQAENSNGALRRSKSTPTEARGRAGEEKAKRSSNLSAVRKKVSLPAEPSVFSASTAESEGMPAGFRLLSTLDSQHDCSQEVRRKTSAAIEEILAEFPVATCSSADRQSDPRVAASPRGSMFSDAKRSSWRRSLKQQDLDLEEACGAFEQQHLPLSDGSRDILWICLLGPLAVVCGVLCGLPVAFATVLKQLLRILAVLFGAAGLVFVVLAFLLSILLYPCSRAVAVFCLRQPHFASLACLRWGLRGVGRCWWAGFVGVPSQLHECGYWVSLLLLQCCLYRSLRFWRPATSADLCTGMEVLAQGGVARIVQTDSGQGIGDLDSQVGSSTAVKLSNGRVVAPAELCVEAAPPDADGPLAMFRLWHPHVARLLGFLAAVLCVPLLAFDAALAAVRAAGCDRWILSTVGRFVNLVVLLVALPLLLVGVLATALLTLPLRIVAIALALLGQASCTPCLACLAARQRGCCGMSQGFFAALLDISWWRVVWSLENPTAAVFALSVAFLHCCLRRIWAPNWRPSEEVPSAAMRRASHGVFQVEEFSAPCSHRLALLRQVDGSVVMAVRPPLDDASKEWKRLLMVAGRPLWDRSSFLVRPATAAQKAHLVASQIPPAVVTAVPEAVVRCMSSCLEGLAKVCSEPTEEEHHEGLEEADEVERAARGLSPSAPSEEDFSSAQELRALSCSRPPSGGGGDKPSAAVQDAKALGPGINSNAPGAGRGSSAAGVQKPLVPRR
eukprot:TRINITY_DN51067_c0_g1_i1.p1 TRINITY_DN51067_c0_g1~~TRINITY_DN51067_c0_g1_i1.p1  ORF type:complete len:1063 (+),score=236.96 TRINITY_DN51067_c0_g1_i1:157-3345(+)